VNDPWLLSTSLPSRLLAKCVVSIYKERMQIEEGFRDMKNMHYGLSLLGNLVRQPKRLGILVLLTTIASILCLFVGLSIESRGHHQRYQSNTVKF